MTFSEDILNIDTPENVAFEYDIAGIGSRFMACMIDTLIIGTVYLVIALGLVALVSLALPDGLEAVTGANRAAVWAIAAVSLLLFAIFWGYYIFFELYWNGQSPGKRVVHLRVIRTDGGPVSLSEAVVRNLVRIIDLLPSAYGIGVITMFISSQSRRLGDLAAGTLVVHDHSPASLESLAALVAVPSQAGLWDSGAQSDLPVERLSAGELHAVEAYLNRREGLFNRIQLAEMMARSLYARMALAGEAPQGPQAEEFLAEINRVWLARLGERSQNGQGTGLSIL